MLLADISKPIDRGVNCRNIQKLLGDPVQNVAHLDVDVVELWARDKFLLRVGRSQPSHSRLERVISLFAKQYLCLSLFVPYIA